MIFSLHTAGLLVIGIAASSCRPSAVVHHPNRSLHQPGATFDSAWSIVHRSYYDSTFKGKNWLEVKRSLRHDAVRARSLQDLRSVIQRMLDTLGDSHARILPASEVETGGVTRLADLGLSARVTSEGAIVWRVDSASAAAEAGVRPGWRIDAVNRVALSSRTTRRQLNALLRGTPGSSVSLELLDNEGRFLTLMLDRAVPRGILAVTPNMPDRVVRFQSVRLPLEGNAAVGLIGFDQWLQPVASALATAMQELRDVDAMIIDLRGNGGGLGIMIAAFAGYFVDTSTVLGLTIMREAVLRVVAQPRAIPGGDGRRFLGPVVLLVDRNTASASEAFAAGMQMAGRARVFGERTAGALLPSAHATLPNGDVMQHPVADYRTLAGTRLEGVGVIPDVLVQTTRTEYVRMEDPVLDTAVRWLRTLFARTPQG